MGKQNNQYKQAWWIVSLAGIGTTIILAAIFLFWSECREEMIELTKYLPFALAILFISICFVTVIAQFIGWVNKRVTNGHGDIGEVSETADKQKDRQISINFNINSSDFTDDRMSTNRMNDFHKLVESISRESNSHSKQSNTKDISKKIK